MSKVIGSQFLWLLFRKGFIPATIAVIGIVCSCALTVVVLSVSDNASRGQTAALDPLATSMGLTAGAPYTPRATGRQSLSDKDVAALSRDLDPRLVSDVVPIASGKALLHYSGTGYRASIYGSTPNWLRYKTTTLTAGRMFSDQECRDGARVAVIGPSILKNLFHGDVASALRANLKVGRLTFRVIGILGKNATGNGGSVVVAPLPVVRNSLLGGIRTVGEIGIVMTGKNAVDAVNSQISSILDPLHMPHKNSGLEEDFSTSTYQGAGVAVADRLVSVLFLTVWSLIVLSAGSATAALACALGNAASSRSPGATTGGEASPGFRRLLGQAAAFATVTGLLGLLGATALILTGAGGLFTAPSLSPRLTVSAVLGACVVVLVVAVVAALRATSRLRSGARLVSVDEPDTPRPPDQGTADRGAAEGVADGFLMTPGRQSGIGGERSVGDCLRHCEARDEVASRRS
ncbi:MAG TPA: ABC transporter permease [Pseudonocardia sp.]|jgi:putative ABC transport system permease protein|nr:ABC transporter permease [Pseudonocardia sp.]